MEKVQLEESGHGEVRHKSGGGNKALLFITIAVLGNYRRNWLLGAALC